MRLENYYFGQLIFPTINIKYKRRILKPSLAYSDYIRSPLSKPDPTRHEDTAH